MTGFYHERMQKSRKVRRCSACCRPIKIGETYLYCVGSHYGFWAAGYHPDCHAAEVAVNSDNSGGDEWSMLHEWVSDSGYPAAEVLSDIASDAVIARLQMDKTP